VMAASQLLGGQTKWGWPRISMGVFTLAFLPVLVCVGWILLANQPGKGWQEGRIDSWSNSIGILGLVHSVGLWHGALAFGFGLVLGLSLDGVPAPTVDTVPADAGAEGAATRPSADEPVAAERRWTARRGRAAPPATPTEEQTSTQEQIPSR